MEKNRTNQMARPQVDDGIGLIPCGFCRDDGTYRVLYDPPIPVRGLDQARTR